MFAHDGAALLDVVTTPDALEVPTHITVAESKGFALSLSKVALEGGIGELVNIARLNLRNIPRRWPRPGRTIVPELSNLCLSEEL